MFNTLRRLFGSSRSENPMTFRSFRPLVEILEDRTLLATYYWVGPPPQVNDFTWNRLGNWSLAPPGQQVVVPTVLPGSNDDVNFPNNLAQMTSVSVVDRDFTINQLISD
jgi:hypothetical protein